MKATWGGNVNNGKPFENEMLIGIMNGRIK